MATPADNWLQGLYAARGLKYPAQSPSMGKSVWDAARAAASPEQIEHAKAGGFLPFQIDPQMRIELPTTGEILAKSRSSPEGNTMQWAASNAPADLDARAQWVADRHAAGLSDQPQIRPTTAERFFASIYGDAWKAKRRAMALGLSRVDPVIADSPAGAFIDPYQVGNALTSKVYEIQVPGVLFKNDGKYQSGFYRPGGQMVHYASKGPVPMVSAHEFGHVAHGYRGDYDKMNLPFFDHKGKPGNRYRDYHSRTSEVLADIPALNTFEFAMTGVPLTTRAHAKALMEKLIEEARPFGDAVTSPDPKALHGGLKGQTLDGYNQLRQRTGGNLKDADKSEREAWQSLIPLLPNAARKPKSQVA